MYREAFASTVVVRAIEFLIALISLESKPIRLLEVVTITEAIRNNLRE